MSLLVLEDYDSVRVPTLWISNVELVRVIWGRRRSQLFPASLPFPQEWVSVKGRTISRHCTHKKETTVLCLTQ